jgi:hypothetical protein
MNSENQEAIDNLLRGVWTGINGYMTERWIEYEIGKTEEFPTAPFADTGAAYRRLLDAGAARRDLALICRKAAFDTAAQLLEDIGPFCEDLGLAGDLAGYDPSGMEGRPGSAPGPKPPVHPGTS